LRDTGPAARIVRLATRSPAVARGMLAATTARGADLPVRGGDGMAERARGGLQQELLRLLRPPSPRRDRLLSERIAPALAGVADALAGRPAEESFAALEAVVTAAGGTPDRRALREFAAEIEAGRNPFG